MSLTKDDACHTFVTVINMQLTDSTKFSALAAAIIYTKSTKMKDFWNERYSQEPMAYGSEPNVFLREQLQQLEPGKLLLPAEGEGRNAVYAALKGWHVSAFDFSEAGYKKAMALAEQRGVTINYQVTDAAQFTCEPESLDAVALIYAHFPPALRQEMHQKVMT